MLPLAALLCGPAGSLGLQLSAQQVQQRLLLLLCTCRLLLLRFQQLIRPGTVIIGAGQQQCSG